MVAVETKEREVYSRERGLDDIHTREMAVKEAGRRLTISDIEMKERENKYQDEIAKWKLKYKKKEEETIIEMEEHAKRCNDDIAVWKVKYRKKEQERSTMEKKYVERMLKDGCILLSSGKYIVKSGGGAVGEHTLVVEAALEKKMRELSLERTRFQLEKTRWKEKRDVWTKNHIEAGSKACELQMYASCLEKGIRIEHNMPTHL